MRSAAGDVAAHPARAAPVCAYDARASPRDDAYAAYATRAAAQSAYDAQAAVDAVWRAADAEAKAVHDARAAPDADNRAAGDAPAEDRAAQVQARLRDLAAQWDVNRACARKPLQALGAKAATAEHLARYPPERIPVWRAYARQQAMKPLLISPLTPNTSTPIMCSSLGVAPSQSDGRAVFLAERHRCVRFRSVSDSPRL